MEYERHERIPMQFLIIEGYQDPSAQHEEEFSGAFISCWIKDQTFQNSIYIAKGWIEDVGWKTKSIEEHKIITGEDYINADEGKEYFDQALIDEEVFVFHTFSNE